tara:strand:- start:16 stop:300 length:285 start_codon:yes stop_codon:yes gene_type:complete
MSKTIWKDMGTGSGMQYWDSPCMTLMPDEISGMGSQKPDSSEPMHRVVGNIPELGLEVAVTNITEDNVYLEFAFTTRDERLCQYVKIEKPFEEL